MVGHTTFDPADSITYYFGARVGTFPSTAATYFRAYIPKSGQIRTGIICQIATSATGTNENIVMSIRKNDTTDYTFATVGQASNTRIFQNLSLSIPVVAGDYIEIKMDCPAWATNPQGVCAFGFLYIECE
jgi:hypothetical protein